MQSVWPQANQPYAERQVPTVRSKDFPVVNPHVDEQLHAAQLNSSAAIQKHPNIAPKNTQDDWYDDQHEEDIDESIDPDEEAMDIARTYISMGEIEQAREILERMIKDGDAKHMREAKHLLERIQKEE